MTTTLNDLINDVSLELHGLTANLEQVTYLRSAINASDLTLAVNDAAQVSAGLLEVDDELLWVQSIDRQSNTVTIAPFGRGYNGTTAATHAQYSKATDNPRFPRSVIKTRIQQALSECYPEVFQVKADESNTANPVKVAYGLPADCDNILSVSVQSIGPSALWIPIRRYTLNTNADTTAFPDGRCIDIGDALPPGRTIRVVYSARPGTLTNNSDTIDSTGLDDNFRDVLVYGACYRLVASLESARLQLTRIEPTDRAQYVNAGSATAGSKYYLGLFQERLANERARLLQIHQSYAHMSR